LISGDKDRSSCLTIKESGIRDSGIFSKTAIDDVVWACMSRDGRCPEPERFRALSLILDAVLVHSLFFPRRSEPRAKVNIFDLLGCDTTCKTWDRTMCRVSERVSTKVWVTAQRMRLE
jgi:hypothetical protein